MGMFMCVFFCALLLDIWRVKWFIKGLSNVISYDILKLDIGGDTVVQKRKRYTIQTKSRMFVVFLFFGAIIATLSYTLVLNLKRVNDMKKELRALEKEQISLLEEEEATEADIKRLSDPVYIARYAREKYFYSKEGEIILRIEE